ncbi:MAG: alpha/beta hydrolase, partial [Marinilabiliales bacterium]
MGSVGQWKDFPSLLSEITNLPALIYDRLGHGKSFKLNHKRRLSFMEEEASLYLPQLLQNLNISHSLILVGHSDGGTISLLTGVFSGLPLEGIISMAAHTYVEEITILGIKEAVQAFQNGRLRSSLEKYHSENTESMFYAWADTWLSPDMRNFDIRKLMSHIRVPCLAIQGKYDQYGSVNQVFSITDAVSENGMPILLDNCGHIPHIQAK